MYRDILQELWGREMWALVLAWLPTFGWILGGTLFLYGIITGTYRSCEQVIGYSNRLLDKEKGKLTEFILFGGGFSIAGGILSLTLFHYKFLYTTQIIYGLWVGGVLGILYAALKKAIWNFILVNSRVTGGVIAGFYGGFLGSIVGGLIGISTGLIVGGIAGGFEERIVTGLRIGVTGGLVGGIASVIGGFSGRLLSGAVGGLIGGALGGVLGGINAPVRFTMLNGFICGIIAGIIGGFVGGGKDGPLDKLVERLTEGRFSGSYGRIDDWDKQGLNRVPIGAYLGVFYGILVSGAMVMFTITPMWSLVVIILGSIVGISFVQVLGVILARTVLFIITPSLILLKHNTILCRQCFRYTAPLQSRYETGRRFCEHCQQEVEQTRIAGKVLFVFGTFVLNVDGEEYPITNPQFELLKLPKRLFVFSNPGFKEPEHILDVSEIYIDTKTCNIKKLERCITYLVNYPPKGGLKAVNIRYQGQLEELGDNLKNSLRNNFTQIAQFA